GEQIAREVLWAELIAVAHEESGPADRESDGADLPRGWGAVGEPQCVCGEDEASAVAEQRGIAELGQANPRIPGREVERIEVRGVAHRRRLGLWYRSRNP